MQECEITTIDTQNIGENREDGCIIDNRTNVIKQLEKSSCAEVTILVLAYNKIEKTKRCINSILENTKGINYELLLVDNGSSDGTLEYFIEIPYKFKKIIRITENKGAYLPHLYISPNMISKYFVTIANDIVVTPNWLENMIVVAESDSKIGMVNPVSSNVSNLQQVNLDFKNFEEMKEMSCLYNVSDPRKWCERLRLITLGTLYKKECLFAIGMPIGDLGFIHNFGDDDIAFRVRRAGYKAILAGDTWVHHDDVKKCFTPEQAQKFSHDLEIGRQNFQEKYFGIDAWDDVNNFIPEIIPQIKPPIDKENCTILGIDTRCGTPILEIKNILRQYDIYNAECCAITSEGKYFIDLQTVCGADNVIACQPIGASDNFRTDSFDYIIIGENINEYPEPFMIIKNVYSLLKKEGQMFVYFKNNYDIYTFLNVIGHRNIRPIKASLNITIEQFLEQLVGMDIKARVAGVVPHTDVPEEYINEVNNRMSAFVQEEWSETAARLTANRFVVKIEKQ